MNTVIKTFRSLLPQNTQVQRKLEIESEVKTLQAALQNKSGEVFKKIISEAGEQFQKDLQIEKEKCLQSLARLNGDFFQDPNSQLKKAWDVIVKLMSSMGIKIEKRNGLDTYEEQLKQMDGNRAPAALLAIKEYKELEAKRNSMVKWLETIISTEKTHSKTLQTTLESAKQNLQKRQKVLCGSYYQDPNGKLDKAWKAYTIMLSTGDASASDLLEKFNKLDNRRKSNDAKLVEIEKQIHIAADPTRTIEILAVDVIKEQIKELEEEKNKESSDWKTNAKTAGAKALRSLANLTTFNTLN